MAQLDAGSKAQATTVALDLKSKRDELAKQLEQAKASKSQAWKELAMGFDKATEDLKGAIADADKALSGQPLRLQPDFSPGALDRPASFCTIRAGKPVTST